MKDRIIVGTRESPLALSQTNDVVEVLKRLLPNVRCEIVKIRTKGDKMHDSGIAPVEGKSMYTEEIEMALTKGEIDVAIHSMKDLTTDLQNDLVIAAVPERVNPRDVLVSRRKIKFGELPAGARVGTSSPRRKSQLLAARGDLEIINMHGNVDTRLRKLKEGEYDAIVLAAAGLIRLGLEKHATEFLSTEVMLPAVGQGALAVETRANDDAVRKLLSQIDHEPSRRAVEAERVFARRLGATCHTPIAAYARIESRKFVIDGMVATPSGSMLIRSRAVSDAPNANKIGEELAETLLSKGAEALLEAA